MGCVYFVLSIIIVIGWESRAAMAADKIVCFVPILNVGCSRQIYGGKLFAYWQAEDFFNEIKINVQCGLM